MKLAVIPPYGHEAMAALGDMQMMLALPYLVARPVYLRTYIDARRRGQYIMLDNGACEGELAPLEWYKDLVRTVQPHEIVAPDVMGDPGGTLEATMTFVENNSDMHDYNIMAVLHCNNVDELLELASTYDKVSPITTLGLPRILVKKYGDKVRHQYAAALRAKYKERFDIHLLGASPKWPGEVGHGRLWIDARSIDTSMPFVLAHAGKELQVELRGVERRPDYFHAKVPLDWELAQRSINRLERWCAGNKYHRGAKLNEG